jgi:hypothetical protein
MFKHGRTAKRNVFNEHENGNVNIFVSTKIFANTNRSFDAFKKCMMPFNSP